MQFDTVAQMADALEVLGARSAHDAVDGVALGEQQLGQIAAVLTGDSRNRRGLHAVASNHE